MNYTQRKKLGVFRGENFLSQVKQSTEISTIFEISKKKDDLADCLLQALSYINFDIQCSTDEFCSTEKIVCRKPSKKQIKTRYSKCNLKWIFKDLIKNGKNKDEIERLIVSDHKTITAIQYWYKSYNNAYDTLTK